MSKVYTTAVVIIPPKDLWDPIQKIRKQYDRHINRWMPHITLLYPFRPESELDELETTFTESCKNLKPFEIILRNFKFFNHGHQNFTIWLAPEPDELIIQLQFTLLDNVPECNDVNLYKNGFTPHLSVGQVKGRNLLNKLLNEMRNSWKELKFKVNTIYFIARKKEKSSKFQVQKQIFLFS